MFGAAVQFNAAPGAPLGARRGRARLRCPSFSHSEQFLESPTSAIATGAPRAALDKAKRPGPAGAPPRRRPSANFQIRSRGGDHCEGGSGFEPRPSKTNPREWKRWLDFGTRGEISSHIKSHALNPASVRSCLLLLLLLLLPLVLPLPLRPRKERCAGEASSR